METPRPGDKHTFLAAALQFSQLKCPGYREITEYIGSFAVSSRPYIIVARGHRTRTG